MTDAAAFEFGASHYLYLLLLLPVLFVLYGYAFRRKRQALAKFADTLLVTKLLSSYSVGLRWLKALCLLAAIALLSFALAQPQWGLSREDVGREGRDLIIMLDVSLSMLAEDRPPNRLAHAKNAIRQLVEKVRSEGGHRMGLVAFAGRANLHCPLTLDYGFFLQRLQDVDTETVPRKGTLIGDALRQVLQGFGFGDIDAPYTDIILITDGEDHGSFPLEAARIAKAQAVGLYTIGVGDIGEGALIPVKNNQGEVSYLAYQDHEVRSRLRQSLLLELTRIGGGTYYAAGLDEIELLPIYEQHIADKERRPIDSASAERLAHRFQWFVLGALLLLILEMFIREKRRQ